MLLNSVHGHIEVCTNADFSPFLSTYFRSAYNEYMKEELAKLKSDSRPHKVSRCIYTCWQQGC
jgi:septin family protein